MATYVRLPPLAVQAEADSTGLNPGNWTAWFQAADININVPFFEMSHASITDGQPGQIVHVNVTPNWTYGGVAIGSGGIEEYDPVNPPIILPGQDVYFFFSGIPMSGTAPTVQAYFRADIDIPANRRNMLGVA